MGATSSCLANCCSRGHTEAEFVQMPVNETNVQSQFHRRHVPSPLQIPITPIASDTRAKRCIKNFIHAIQESPRQLRRFLQLVQRSPRAAYNFVMTPRRAH